MYFLSFYCLKCLFFPRTTKFQYPAFPKVFTNIGEPLSEEEIDEMVSEAINVGCTLSLAQYSVQSSSVFLHILHR